MRHARENVGRVLPRHGEYLFAEHLFEQIVNDLDVRTAFLNLNADKEQVLVAQKNVALANENLARSKDRFISGVTDSVEVVQSEQSLASANDQFITSVYNHNLAELMLARALGVARQLQAVHWR